MAKQTDMAPTIMGCRVKKKKVQIVINPIYERRDPRITGKI